MPRFAILTHDSPHLHWDLLLEKSATLRAWRLSHPPDSATPIAAEALPDHRLLYLDYEGPISGNRGTVHRWDGGEYCVEYEDDQALCVDLRGGRWQGRVRLSRSQAGWQLDVLTDAS